MENQEALERLKADLLREFEDLGVVAVFIMWSPQERTAWLYPVVVVRGRPASILAVQYQRPSPVPGFAVLRRHVVTREELEHWPWDSAFFRRHALPVRILHDPDAWLERFVAGVRQRAEQNSAGEVLQRYASWRIHELLLTAPEYGDPLEEAWWCSRAVERWAHTYYYLLHRHHEYHVPLNLVGGCGDPPDEELHRAVQQCLDPAGDPDQRKEQRRQGMAALGKALRDLMDAKGFADQWRTLDELGGWELGERFFDGDYWKYCWL